RVSGSKPPWPERKIHPPTESPGEYGPTGVGVASELIKVFIREPPLLGLTQAPAPMRDVALLREVGRECGRRVAGSRPRPVPSQPRRSTRSRWVTFRAAHRRP